MAETRFERAKQSVETMFAHPKDILDATEFSRDQKIELLNQWKQDLRQLIVASEEGMTATHPGRAAEMLRNVDAALSQIEAP